MASALLSAPISYLASPQDALAVDTVALVARNGASPQDAEISYLFSVSLMHITDHIPFRRHFHYHHIWWTTKRRCKKWHFDNVERSKTTNKSYLESWYVDYNLFCNFPNVSSFSRWLSKKNNISCLMWVCLKVSKTMLFRSIWRKRRFIKLWFLM